MDDTENVGIEKEDTPKLVFKFQYQNWKPIEEFNESNGDNFHLVNNPDAASSSASKCEFISGKSARHFLEEPEVSILTVRELFVQSNDGSLENKEIQNFGFLPESEGRDVLEHKAEKLKPRPYVKAMEQPESGKNQVENPHISAIDVFSNLGRESNSKSSNINSLIDSQLSDSDLGTTVKLDKSGNQDDENAGLTEEDMVLEGDSWSDNLDVGYEPDDFDGEDKDLMEELQKLEEEAQEQKLSGNDKVSSKAEEFGDKEKRPIDCPMDSAKPNLQSSIGSDLEDSNRFDTLWEHQDLIEQLKMELKKVKATGLPTILEDSEFPRIVEDLKPWKIEEKFQPGTSTTNEVPKFYKSYRERMRKFDILNYQKMCAIDFLQSKEPIQSFSSRMTSTATIMSQLSQSFHLSRRKKSETDPTKKFVRELYSDLETIYVGQLSLSWEFLQWEYEKALELWDSDQYGTRRFNEVAGEFQQFQVLLQRFIENEPFQGPRVENYVRNRRAMKNLLQVPVIREDNTKDKKKTRKRDSDNDAITSDMLVEILEESIRTIWRFIRADKDACNLTLKGVKENQTELQDPADSELLAQVRAGLQKKEKRLREILRSGSCILKKFQKRKEEGTDQYLYFFSQVDMKLVWRVLNMSRITTDQLAWCSNKLNKINFVHRTLHVEPTFLLFPS
ncbi:uncharacterized protein LOC129304437 isoform X2 [Prosopis cineraria]|nr:uncharacterized protein LOC129304437 isoform X2 [Prosopis cineraria]